MSPTHAELCARSNIIRTCVACGQGKPVSEYVDSPWMGPLGSNLRFCAACQTSAIPTTNTNQGDPR